MCGLSCCPMISCTSIGELHYGRELTARRNVIVVKQLIYNDISSTKVRLFVRRGMSIKYLLPNSVIQYIHEHKLYREPDRNLLTA